MASQTTPSLMSIQDLTNIFRKETIINVPVTPEAHQAGISEKYNQHLHSDQNENKLQRSPKSNSAITIASTKPSLTSVKSRNDLIQYALSKHYQEDFNNNSHIKEKPTSNSHQMENQPENTSNCSEYDELLHQQERRLPVPISKKDDEKFKLLKMKSLKRMSLPSNKSVKKYENDKASYEKEFDNSMEYSIIKKRRVSHSTKKTYVSTLVCYSNEGDETAFPIYIDKDIGIYEYWQTHIIESKADEDIMTDKEQLCLANSFIISELREALDLVEKEGNSIIVNTKFIQ